jgi:hypothetical protein
MEGNKNKLINGGFYLKKCWISFKGIMEDQKSCPHGI